MLGLGVTVRMINMKLLVKCFGDETTSPMAFQYILMLITTFQNTP